MAVRAVGAGNATSVTATRAAARPTRSSHAALALTWTGSTTFEPATLEPSSPGEPPSPGTGPLEASSPRAGPAAPSTTPGWAQAQLRNGTHASSHAKTASEADSTTAATAAVGALVVSIRARNAPLSGWKERGVEAEAATASMGARAGGGKSANATITAAVSARGAEGTAEDAADVVAGARVEGKADAGVTGSIAGARAGAEVTADSNSDSGLLEGPSVMNDGMME